MNLPLLSRNRSLSEGNNRYPSSKEWKKCFLRIDEYLDEQKIFISEVSNKKPAFVIPKLPKNQDDFLSNKELGGIAPQYKTEGFALDLSKSKLFNKLKTRTSVSTNETINEEETPTNHLESIKHLFSNYKSFRFCNQARGYSMPNS